MSHLVGCKLNCKRKNNIYHTWLDRGWDEEIFWIQTKKNLIFSGRLAKYKTHGFYRFLVGVWMMINYRPPSYLNRHYILKYRWQIFFCFIQNCVINYNQNLFVYIARCSILNACTGYVHAVHVYQRGILIKYPSMDCGEFIALILQCHMIWLLYNVNINQIVSVRTGTKQIY